MSSIRAALIAALLAVAGSAGAYVPGTGNLVSDAFTDGDDAGWMDGRIGGSRLRVAAGGYVADGVADAFRSLPESSVRAFPPVFPGSVDACFGVTLPAGVATELVVELRPPRDDAAWHALVLRGDGSAVMESRSAAGGVVLATARIGTIPVGAPAWIRWRLSAAAGGATDVSLRAWTGGAAAEPGAGWDARGATPGADPCPRVQRLRLTGAPAAGSIVVDDIDVFGDTAIGVPSSITTVHIVELSHLDIGFTRPPDEIETFAKTHLDQVLANLRADPGYRWTIENSWWLLRWRERSSPAEIDEMTVRLREGRISLSAGYANLHSTIASREELIRGITYSAQAGRTDGYPIRTYVHDDVPGATWALPEILAKSGVEYYVGGMNTPFGGRITAPGHGERPFWWEGPDGSRVLSWITFDSYAEGLGKYGLSFFDNLAALRAGLATGLPEQEALGYPHSRLLIMRGFDNHYQGLFVKRLVDQWNARYSTPRLVLSSPEEFLDVLRQDITATGWTIPVFRGDFGGAWTSVVPGTPETHRLADEAKRDVEAAETFSAVAGIFGTPHPAADLATAWRRVLEVDEHSGGGVPWPDYMTPEETDRQSRIHLAYAQEAQAAASRALGASLNALAARVDLPRGGIVVFNARDSARAAPVRAGVPAATLAAGFRLIDVARGEEVPWQRDGVADAIVFIASVPATGYAAYRMLSGPSSVTDAGGLLVGPSSVENGAWRASLDPVDGSLSSLVNVATGRELVDSGSSWRFGQSASNTNAEVFFAVRPVADVPSSVTITPGERGPVRASLIVTRTGSPATRMEITLWRGLDRVEVDSVLDEREMPFVPESMGSRAYALTFPLAMGDFRFGTESPARLLQPSLDGFERDGSFAALNSLAAIAVADDAATIVAAAPGRSISEWGGISQLVPAHRTARAELFVRAVAKSDEALYRGGIVGPVEAEPGMPKTHDVPLRLRLLPADASEAEIRRAGWDLADDLHAVHVAAGAGPLPAGGRTFFALSDEGARLAAVKRATDGSGIVVRVEDAAGIARSVELRSIADLSQPVAADLLEAPGAPLAMTGAAVGVPVTPFATTTLRAQATLALSPVLLRVTKDEARRDVLLRWTGGVPGFRVLASLRRDFTGSTRILDAAAPARTHDDAGMLRDGSLWFYDIQ